MAADFAGDLALQTFWKRQNPGQASKVWTSRRRSPAAGHMTDETLWALHDGYGTQGAATPRWRWISALTCISAASPTRTQVEVVPATAAPNVLRHKPDGIFPNGPGDPAATGEYAVPVIRQLIKFGVPMFGICLGHQLLSLALAPALRKCISATAAPTAVRTSPPAKWRSLARTTASSSTRRPYPTACDPRVAVRRQPGRHSLY